MQCNPINGDKLITHEMFYFFRLLFSMPLEMGSMLYCFFFFHPIYFQFLSVQHKKTLFYFLFQKKSLQKLLNLSLVSNQVEGLFLFTTYILVRGTFIFSVCTLFENYNKIINNISKYLVRYSLICLINDDANVFVVALIQAQLMKYVVLKGE